MPTDFHASFPEWDKFYDEQTWCDLHSWLLPIVRGWAYQTSIITWRVQRSEIAEEITQEALMRAFECTQRARANKCPPVGNLKAFCYTIARRLCIDRQKKDWRIVYFPPDGSYEVSALNNEQLEPAEIAVDHLILEETIALAAENIACYPFKQRVALLSDLANITDFTTSPSLLEQAFAKLGIQLREYVRQRSDDLKARNRQAALLWNAYQRLKKLSDK